MLVLTLHPVPAILKEALGRTVGSVQKRRGTRGREGAGPKERKLAPTSEGPSIPPSPSVSPSGRCPLSSLPSPQRFLSLASCGGRPQYIRRQRVVLGGEDLWARGHSGSASPRAPAPPSSPPRLSPPLPGRLAGGGACAPGSGRRGARVQLLSAGAAGQKQKPWLPAGPRGLAVGGERNAGARRAPPDKCFCVRPRLLPSSQRTVLGMRTTAAAVPREPKRR